MPNKTRRKVKMFHGPWRAVLACLLLFGLSGVQPGVAGAAPEVSPELDSLFSYGAGPVELFVFTDYFCPPCRSIEGYLETALKKLYHLGVRITFVDMPFHQKSGFYAAYFLYGARAAGGFNDALRIRKTLFELARTDAVNSDAEMIRHFKEKKISFALINLRPVFEAWTALIQRFSVSSTPVCIVTRPGQEPQVFKGSGEIPAGIDRLIEAMTPAPPAANETR